MITYPNAVDENGNVHNIGEITQDNRAEHKYYCLGCDKEMVPVLCKDKEPHFRHKVNDLCNPETYLHNLAKKYLAKQFETRQKFEVSYYATNDCPRKESCQLYGLFHWKECYGTRLYTFDLKEKYDTCQVEGVYDGYRADVLLTSSKNPETPPVFLEVSVSHDCTLDKLESGNLIIEMKIRNEDDYKRPIVENKGQLVPAKEDTTPQYSNYRYFYYSLPEPSFIMFHNFDRIFHQDDLKKLDFFALFKNGKIGVKEQFIACKDVGSKYLEASVFELSLLRHMRYGSNGQRYDFFNLGLTQAMLHKQPIRHCVYCTHYRNCTVPMEIERVNWRTGQKEKVIQRVYNTQIKNNQMDKYELASKCHNWLLNEPLCNQVKSYYHADRIFIWEAPKEAE